MSHVDNFAILTYNGILEKLQSLLRELRGELRRQELEQLDIIKVTLSISEMKQGISGTLNIYEFFDISLKYEIFNLQASQGITIS